MKEREITQKKEQVAGLNRMDFETFVVALTEIGTQIYQNYYDDLQGAWMQRGEGQALQKVITEHVQPLDEGI